VGHAGHLGPGERATTPSGVSARLLHLACIWIHVGKEPPTEKKGWVELLCLDMRYRLVDTPGLGGQKLHVDWHRNLVLRNGHGIRSFRWGKNRCRTLADIHDANLRSTQFDLTAGLLGDVTPLLARRYFAAGVRHLGQRLRLWLHGSDRALLV